MTPSSLNLSQHIFITASDEVIQITKPLFEFLPINYFRFFRLWKDGSYIRLSTNAHWTSHYMSENYTGAASPQSIFKTRESNFYLLDLLPANVPISQVLKDAKQYFYLDHGFSILDASEDFIDIYDLTAHPSQININELYLRYAESIKKFTKYFNSKAYKIINKAASNKIKFMHDNNSDYSAKLFEKKKQFELSIKMENLVITNAKVNIQLSKRETQCIVGIIKGKTTKMIGKELGLSSRTVEQYINNLKLKLKCTYKTDLLKMFENEIHTEKFII